MLIDDIATIEDLVLRYEFAEYIGCWNRIKTALAESTDTSTNKTQPEILQYLEMAIGALDGDGVITARQYIRSAIAKLQAGA